MCPIITPIYLRTMASLVSTYNLRLKTLAILASTLGTEKNCSHQTVKFPFQSSAGNIYVMITYTSDIKATIITALKFRNFPHLLQSIQKRCSYLSRSGYQPKIHYLNKEAPISAKKLYQPTYNTNWYLPSVIDIT